MADSSGPQTKSPKDLSLGKAVLYTAEGVFSKDAPTRRYSFLFWSALVGLGLSVWAGVRLLAPARPVDLGTQVAGHAGEEGEDQGENLNKFFSKTQQEAQTFYTTLELGKFTIQLKNDPLAKTKAAPGVLHLAEVDMTVECTSKEVCQFVEDNMPKARDSVSEILVAVDQKELMTVDGKGRLKAAILGAINRWLKNAYSDGEQKEVPIRSVYFTKLVIG